MTDEAQPIIALLPYQQRMLDEHSELKGRVLRLETYLNDPHAARVSVLEAQRMMEQRQFMYGYLTVLGDRIRVFWPELPR